MSFLVAQNLTKLGITHGFFTKEDGVSTGSFAGRNVKHGLGDDWDAVEQNRQRCLDELGLSGAEFVYAKLTHGTGVHVVSKGEKSADIDDVDAIISHESNTVIGLSTADCVPILLADPASKAVAVVHAGWRGLEQGVIPVAIEKLRSEYDIESSSLVAAIGPAIAQSSYEVGPEVAGQFAAQFVAKKGTSLYLDLIAITQSQLAAAGVTDVETTAVDVFKDERYYSYRGDGPETGRQLTVICSPQ